MSTRHRVLVLMTLAACAAVTSSAGGAFSEGAAPARGPLADRIVFSGFAPHHTVVAIDPRSGRATALTPERFPAEIDPGDMFGLRASVGPESVGVSPDGTTAVFGTDRRNDKLGGELFAVGADGKGMRRLTSTPNRIESSPVFSPDGRRIAFLSDAATGETDSSRVSLGIMRSDGSEPQLIATAQPGMGERSMTISWHPDSRRLLFSDGSTDSAGQATTLLLDVMSGTRRTLRGSTAQFSRAGKIALEWGSDVYVGTADQLSRPLFARTLKPRLTSRFTGTGVKSLIHSFAWLPDGRLLFTGIGVATCPPRQPSGAPWLAVSQGSGATRVLWKRKCAYPLFLLSPSSTGAEYLVLEGISGRVVDVRSGRVRPLAYASDMRGAVWGWQPRSVRWP